MRLLGHTLTAASVAAFSLLVAPACADNDQGIFIRQVISPGAADRNAGGGCTYTPDPTGAAIGEGVVDAALRDTYSMSVIVGNQLIVRADTLQPRTEPNRARIEGAIVRVADASDNTLGEFTATSQGFADPSTGALPGFGIASFTAIDAPTMARIAANLQAGQARLVIAKVRIFGKTLGGVDLESGEFSFPVRVCMGCLVSFRTGDDPVAAGVDCNVATPAGQQTSTEGLPCLVGQDEGVPCELCRNSRAACAARPCASDADCSQPATCQTPVFGEGPPTLKVCR